MALRALKPITYQGSKLKLGDLLDPAPDPTRAGMLLRGRYAYDDTQTAPQTRPVGTGVGRRARAARKSAAAVA